MKIISACVFFLCFMLIGTTAYGSSVFSDLQKHSSYQTAGLAFLPNVSGFSSSSSGGGKTSGVKRKCSSSYSLKKCPDGGVCRECTYEKKFMLIRCEDGFLRMKNDCIKKK